MRAARFKLGRIGKAGGAGPARSLARQSAWPRGWTEGSKGELPRRKEMGRIDSGPVGAYIAARPTAIQPQLRRVRRAIRRAIPNAEEVMTYEIPTYKLHGRAVLYFAAWKAHFSLYPASDSLLAAFRSELASHEVRKRTIRFPYSGPVPAGLIERIAAFRAVEARARVKVRTGGSAGRGRKAS